MEETKKVPEEGIQFQIFTNILLMQKKKKTKIKKHETKIYPRKSKLRLKMTGKVIVM